MLRLATLIVSSTLVLAGCGGGQLPGGGETDEHQDQQAEPEYQGAQYFQADVAIDNQRDFGFFSGGGHCTPSGAQLVILIGLPHNCTLCARRVPAHVQSQ